MNDNGMKIMLKNLKNSDNVNRKIVIHLSGKIVRDIARWHNNHISQFLHCLFKLLGDTLTHQG